MFRTWLLATAASLFMVGGIVGCAEQAEEPTGAGTATTVGTAAAAETKPATKTEAKPEAKPATKTETK